MWRVTGTNLSEWSVTDDQSTANLRPDDFETFYRVEGLRVYHALAMTLRDLDLAEDAAAEGLARTYQHWNRIQNYDSPAGWAYRVGLNWATSWLRRLGRQRLQPASDLLHNDPQMFDPGLHLALMDLDVDQRSVVVMRYLLDLSQEEIGRLLGVPVGTVKSRLARGLTRLREVVEP